MTYTNFPSTYNQVKANLGFVRDRALPPVAEIFTAKSTSCPVGLTPDGRTVKWMRNVQGAIAALVAGLGAIIGSFPGVIIGAVARMLKEDPLVLTQQIVTNTVASCIFHRNTACDRYGRDQFISTFSMPSTYPAIAAANDAFGSVVGSFAYTGGIIGLGVGSIVSSVIVPPISGSVNLIEHLVR